MNRLIDQFHAAVMLPPVADAFSGTVSTTPVRLGIYPFLHALIVCGVGTVGTATVTVEACSDASGSNPEAIPFKLNKQAPGANAADTWLGYADVTAAGFVTTAGSHKLLAIDVDARDLPTGKPFVRITSVEVADGAVIAAIIGLFSNGRYFSDSPSGVFA